MLLNKSDRDIIRKRLEKIDKEKPNRTRKRRLLEELNNILLDLEFKKSHINVAYDSSTYYGLKDLEYTFGNLDDYYIPILAKECFNGNYQIYTCRGDKERNMYKTNYLEKIKLYLIPLTNKKKVSNQKIQLDIEINLVHLTKSDRIAFYVKSKNIECHPSDNSEDILNQLFDSLLKYFNDKLLICRTDSSYVFDSVEGISIHFHKIDLRRGSSYIPTPEWLENKKAAINPKNMKANYCFAYAVTIAIFHKEIGSNLDRISNRLLKYTEKLDWNGIDFLASTSDYKRFEKVNEDITLNSLYVAFNEKDKKESVDVLPEYVSKFNFTRKKQVLLLKVSNGNKWHFLALKSEQEENDCMKPTKSFSKLMRDISSNSHENYYWFGCFHSFRCKSTLEKHTQLCKDHEF